MFTKGNVISNLNAVSDVNTVTKNSSLDMKHRLNDEYLRLLWDVCKNFGLPGECIFLCMKGKLKHTNRDS